MQISQLVVAELTREELRAAILTAVATKMNDTNIQNYGSVVELQADGNGATVNIKVPSPE